MQALLWKKITRCYYSTILLCGFQGKFFCTVLNFRFTEHPANHNQHQSAPQYPISSVSMHPDSPHNLSLIHIWIMPKRTCRLYPCCRRRKCYWLFQSHRLWRCQSEQWCLGFLSEKSCSNRLSAHWCHPYNCSFRKWNEQFQCYHKWRNKRKTWMCKDRLLQAEICHLKSTSHLHTPTVSDRKRMCRYPHAPVSYTHLPSNRPSRYLVVSSLTADSVIFSSVTSPSW